MLNILIFAIVIYFIVKRVKQKNEEQSSQNTESKRESIKDLDNDYFLIKGGRLLEYRGKKDFIIVPNGVDIIGGSDTKICSQTIRGIYIPKSVYVIADCALPYVEIVYYEGSEESLHYDKKYNFYTDGWRPDWTIPGPHIKINEVRFHYNFKNYDVIAQAHYEKVPDELKPRN